MAEFIELANLGLGTIEEEGALESGLSSLQPGLGGDGVGNYFTTMARDDAINDYLDEQLYRQAGYDSSNIDNLLQRGSIERNVGRHYGYEPDELANLNSDEYPEQFMENLDYSYDRARDPDQTIPKK